MTNEVIMPTFDIVSEVDQHELQNAVDQANREISTRFDFKGTDSTVTLEKNTITIESASKFQVEQIFEVLKNRVSKRSIDIRALDSNEVSENLSRAQMEISVQQGIDKDHAKKLQKIIKTTKLKVQSSIQGEQVRVSGKKRDDLQTIMNTLREEFNDIALQFNNFRD
jgi:cyclic-di-GMP-binding protein